MTKTIAVGEAKQLKFGRGYSKEFYLSDTIVQSMPSESIEPLARKYRVIAPNADLLDAVVPELKVYEALKIAFHRETDAGHALYLHERIGVIEAGWKSADVRVKRIWRWPQL